MLLTGLRQQPFKAIFNSAFEYHSKGRYRSVITFCFTSFRDLNMHVSKRYLEAV